MLLDRNGLRAGKFSGQIPAIVQAWVAQNATRIEQDPMEQAGVVADVSSFSQLWRCRPDQRKVLTVRNLPKETVTLFYNEEGFRGGQFPAPHFLFSLYAKPNGPQSAQVLLRPELEFGQTRRSVVAKDSAIRTEERRETLRWESLSLMLTPGCPTMGPLGEEVTADTLLPTQDRGMLSLTKTACAPMGAAMVTLTSCRLKGQSVLWRPMPSLAVTWYRPGG
jgi:hypothetical protein